MRIQLDDSTEKELDQIKRELHVFGAGHSNTIAALIQNYKLTRDFAAVADQKLSQISVNITEAFNDCARNFAANLFSPRLVEKKPEEPEW